jgi:DNA-binding NarL/FixJ family response regulator
LGFHPFARPAAKIVAQFPVHRSSYTKVDKVDSIHHHFAVIKPTSGPCSFVHYGPVKTSPLKTTSTIPSRLRKSSALKVADAPLMHLLIADSGPLQSQLLTRALRARREFHVSAVPLNLAALGNFLQSNPVDVALIAGSQLPDWGLLRWLRVTYPGAAPVLLAENDDRDLVLNALRAGAKGIFLFMQDPFRMLCKCIQAVYRGEIWINNQQMRYVMDALGEVPTLRVVNSNGRSLLTPREEQVVALVTDGLSNREVAVELGLSEHTIKKYLLRIFDKVGVSSRVELVLYAMSHGENRPAEWMPSAAQLRA